MGTVCAEMWRGAEEKFGGDESSMVELGGPLEEKAGRRQQEPKGGELEAKLGLWSFSEKWGQGGQ